VRAVDLHRAVSRIARTGQTAEKGRFEGSRPTMKRTILIALARPPVRAGPDGRKSVGESFRDVKFYLLRLESRTTGYRFSTPTVRRPHTFERKTGAIGRSSLGSRDVAHRHRLVRRRKKAAVATTTSVHDRRGTYRLSGESPFVSSYRPWRPPTWTTTRK
jgi:hypothetical protein